MEQAPPTILAVGRTKTRTIGSYKAPAAVRGPNDLPERLFFGDIQTGSFSLSPEEWSAEYADPSGDFSVNIRLETERLHLSYAWHGVSTYQMRPACPFPDLAKHFQFPSEWSSRLAESIRTKYNARYFPLQEGEPNFCFFPDGPGMVIACPVRIARIQNALRAMESIRDDENIRTTIFSYYVCTLQVVNFIKDRNTSVPDDPATLFYWSLYSNGLAPAELPVWEGSDETQWALTLRRPMYYLIVSLQFRELERTLAHLHANDLIGDASDHWEERSYEAPEFSALVFHTGSEFVSDIWYMDDAGTRRTFLPSLVTPSQFAKAMEQFPLNDEGWIAQPSMLHPITSYSEDVIRRYEHLAQQP